VEGLSKTERLRKDTQRLKVYDEVFDHITLMCIYRLIKRKLLDTLDYPISSGKEAVIFSATSPQGDVMAAKIYRVSNATFKTISKYIDGDPRFSTIGRSQRQVIYAWAKKEYKNLNRMQSANVNVPGPIQFMQNILLMDYIGSESQPAPQLRDVKLRRPAQDLHNIIEQMRLMYQDAHLVHGDLSEYNILVNGDDLVIIDVGQSVVSDHPQALEFLNRDVRNILNHFQKRGVKRDIEKVTENIRRGKKPFRR